MEDLKREKITAEIELLQAKLKNDYPKKVAKNKKEKLVVFIKNWYAVVLGLCTLGISIWGVFYPLKTYFDDKSKEMEYNLNRDMISLTSKLTSEIPQEQTEAVMMLSYYEQNSIKILLHFLERTGDESLRDEIVSTLENIYKEHGKKINELSLEHIKINAVKFKEQEFDANSNSYRALLNYMKLVEIIDLKKNNGEKIINYLSDFYNEIKCDKVVNSRCESIADSESEALCEKICSIIKTYE